MSEPERPIMVDIPIDEFNTLITAYTILMNEMQARGHDLASVVTAGFYTLGAATAQGGGAIPEALLLKELEPFVDGYCSGLAVLRAQMQ